MKKFWHFKTTGLHQASFCDASEQASWVGCAQYQQLSAGEYHGSIICLTTPDMFVVRERQNRAILKRVEISAGACSVSLLDTAPGPLRVGGHAVDPQDIGYIPEGADIDLQTRDDQSVTFFVFRQQALTEAARTVLGDDWDRHAARGLIARAPTLAALSRMADRLLAPVEDPARTSSLAMTAADVSRWCLSRAIMALGDAVEGGGVVRSLADGPEHYCVVVRRARDFIEASAHEGISIVDVCAAVGVERRTLQRAFERVMGLNPLAYLQVVRLNRARTMLLHGDPARLTVFDVASRCGAWHLSRFTQAYRRMFGETPGQTLRRDR
jgi:AraC family ethanolamine operon transcriptional activator